MLYRVVVAALIIIYHSAVCRAQDKVMSPELAAMRGNARQYLAMGNYKAAITTYRQLAELEKPDADLLTDLGRAYYYDGDLKAAEKTLEQAIDMPAVNDTAYCTLSAAYLADRAIRAANVFAGLGLKKFPASGILFEQRGLVYDAAANYNDALTCWMDGINNAPTYAGNYKKAAMAAGNGNVWAILWGETYLCMQHDTTGDAIFKQLLFDKWKTYFAQLPDTRNTGTQFEQLVANTFLSLSPVVSDGIGVESITMIKTRFMLRWTKALQIKYPLPLFALYEQMLSHGQFDIYNEWLFGMAESETQYKAWTNFHAGDMDKFQLWLSAHYLAPVAVNGLASDATIILAHNQPKKKKR